MEQNKNNLNENENPRPLGEGIIKLAAVLIGAAVVISCYSYTQVDEPFVQTVWYCVAAMLIVVASFLITVVVFARRADKHRNNFFLYDRKTRRDLPVSELTFGEMRKRLLGFMSIFRRRGKIFVGDLLVDEKAVPEHFKPLLCYEILYELATDDGMDAESFLSFGPECADVFSKYLRANEDYELAVNIRSFIFDFADGNKRIDEFKSFMSTKAKHIEGKMLDYARTNIEKFK